MLKVSESCSRVRLEYPHAPVLRFMSSHRSKLWTIHCLPTQSRFIQVMTFARYGFTLCLVQLPNQDLPHGLLCWISGRSAPFITSLPLSESNILFKTRMYLTDQHLTQEDRNVLTGNIPLNCAFSFSEIRTP